MKATILRKKTIIIFSNVTLVRKMWYFCKIGLRNVETWFPKDSFLNSQLNSCSKQKCKFNCWNCLNLAIFCQIWGNLKFDKNAGPEKLNFNNSAMKGAIELIQISIWTLFQIIRQTQKMRSFQLYSGEQET